MAACRSSAAPARCPSPERSARARPTFRCSVAAARWPSGHRNRRRRTRSSVTRIGKQHLQVLVLLNRASRAGSRISSRASSSRRRHSSAGRTSACTKQNCARSVSAARQRDGDQGEGTRRPSLPQPEHIHRQIAGEHFQFAVAFGSTVYDPDGILDEGHEIRARRGISRPAQLPLGIKQGHARRTRQLRNDELGVGLERTPMVRISRLFAVSTHAKEVLARKGERTIGEGQPSNR